MFRKIISIALTISFVAMGSSGILMLFNEGFAFQLKMHPVHNIFAVVMIVAGLAHLCLNYKPLMAYLKLKPVWILGLVLTILMTLLYTAGLNRPMDPEMMERFNALDLSKNRGPR